MGRERAHSCSGSSPSTGRKSSEFSSLVASPLTPLAEAASISPFDVKEVRSSASVRAHSLSYSAEASAKAFALDAPSVAILGPWSDDAQLLRRFQRSNPFISRGRGAPRGGRQPRRMSLQVDSLHRLPEFVSDRLHKARAHSMGARYRA